MRVIKEFLEMIAALLEVLISIKRFILEKRKTTRRMSRFPKLPKSQIQWRESLDSLHLYYTIRTFLFKLYSRIRSFI